MPSGPGVRVDTAIEPGDRIPPDYDNLIAKLMVHAPDRDAAIDRLRRALDETEIGGVQTSLPFHRTVAIDETFRAADLSIDWVAQHWDGERAHTMAARRALVAAGLLARSLGSSGIAGHATAMPVEQSDHHRQPDGWRRSARATAADRWPR